ncbi:MAG: Osmoregulated proline transporter OpuE [Chlamydiae bacterium]|nr:Osmoregulated proline transporter OpuE [Chlamydiota bacterium]
MADSRILAGMNSTVFFLLLFVLAAGSLWLGQRAGKKSKTQEEFFLMGRSLGLFALVMTLLATQIGGGALLGAAEEAYTKGWSVLFYPLGMVVGLIVLGLGYGARMRKLQISTVPEIFEKRYRSVSLRKFASLLSIVSLFCILVGQAIASRKFFLSLGFDSPLLFISFWMVLVLYTVMGGLRAVVSTDILQVAFILLALGMAFGASLFGTPSVETSPQLLTESAPWFTWLFMPLLFMLIEQDMGQRCFAAKNPRIVSIAAICAAAILLLVSLAPIYFGALAGKHGIPIPEGGSVLITAVQAFTNPLFSTFLICAILMAILSTADSLLCSVSSHIACDFPMKNPPRFLSQGITLFVGLATFALSFLFTSVVGMLMFSYELAVCVLFVPVTLGVYAKAPQKRSALLAMGAGLFAFVAFKFYTPPLPKELLSLTLAAGVFGINEWASRRLPAYELPPES